MQNYVDVILPIPVDRLFTYIIPEDIAETLEPGLRIAVPFGKTKVYSAIVFNTHNSPPHAYEAKSIHQIIDDTPIVTQQQLDLWQWISSYYMCTLGEVMRAALPSAFLLESETVVFINEGQQVQEEQLTDDEFLVYEALEHQSTLKADDIKHILDRKTILPVLNSLFEKDVIFIKEEISEKYRPKLQRFVILNEDYKSEAALEELINGMNRAPKQRDILLAYFKLSGGGPQWIGASELLREGAASSAQLRSLIDKGVLMDEYKEVDRLEEFNDVELTPKHLTEVQEEAYQKISGYLNERKTTLLHGVTSSGKTEIYVRLIREALKRHEQVLYLVPEIALTTQLVNRIRKYFGNELAVYHSKYSLNERVEVWHHVHAHDEKARIILGARSAVWLPFQKLGLVIVDEEHEPSYKQFDPAPRYHARDAAIVLADMFKSKILLGSATPSLESYYNAFTIDKYALVELKERYNKLLMPEIELVDIKDKYRRKRMTGHFSDRLIEVISETLEEDQQVILFQNRRGFSPIIECRRCGHSPQCPHCDVSLTYHQYKDQLRCHYCGFSAPMIKSCEACSGFDLDSKGFGTQQVEEEVKSLFPEARVARMDLDTTRGKQSYEKIISGLENREIDILVGTQMLTKGLDFRHVRTVGIMNADALLNFPDFRAHERSFQLMQQVAGRSGRTDMRGKVIIQTYNPYHRIVQQVSMYDYAGMYTDQLEDRRIYHYPPFYRLIRITLRHKDFNKVNQGADWLTRSLRQVLAVEVLGPEFPPVARIRRQYNKNILI